MRDRDRFESELLELRAVADALDSSLRRLAAGDVHQQMDVPLPRSFDHMRKDFNRGLTFVGTTIDGILARTRELRSESVELRDRLKAASDDEVSRSGVIGATMAGLGSAEDASKSQSAHVDHISTILQNARRDMERPKLAAFSIGEDLQRTCQSLAQLKGLVDDAKTMLREASLIALNGGVNAAKSGEPGEEALGIAKNLHALTQQIGSTIDAIGDATERVLETSGSASDTAGRLDRELDALSLYLGAADTQLQQLGEKSKAQGSHLNTLRTDLGSVARKARSDDAAVELSPTTHLDAMDRAAAEIERLADRFHTVPDFTPPGKTSPHTGRRSHLTLVKT